MLHQTTGRWRYGLFLSLVAAFFWASLPIALKYVLASEETEGLDAITVTWFRFSLSAALLAAYILFRKRSLLNGHLWQGRKPWLFLISAVCLCFNYLFFVWGLEFLSPSAAAVVIQLAPMFLLVGSLMVFKEAFSRAQWAGFALLALGMLLFFNDKRGELLPGLFKNETDGAPFDVMKWFVGVLLVISASLFWAIYALGQKQLLKKISSEIIMLYIYVVGLVLFLPLAEPTGVRMLTGPQLAILFYCGLNTLFAYGSFAEALDHWEASRVSATVSITPLLTIFIMKLGHYWFPQHIENESLNLVSVFGGCMVVGGSMLCALGRRNNQLKMS